MRLTLRYASQQKATGSWVYRRRVPKALATVISKREFKGKLGDTRHEALRRYPSFHQRIEREIALAEAQLQKEIAENSGELSDRAAYELAMDRAGELVAEVSSWEARDALADGIAAQYPCDPKTGAPIGATDVDRHLINIVRNGAERTPKPQLTINDAKEAYFQSKAGTDNEVALGKLKGRLDRVVSYVDLALGKAEVEVARLNRTDARKVCEWMLDRKKVDGTPVSYGTVQRELNTLKSVLNHAVNEHMLPQDFRNPFNNLRLPAKVSGSSSGQGDKRDPLPPKVLVEVRARLLTRCNKEVGLVWRILESTGCRLAEVSGAKVEDVVLDVDLPHLIVRPNEFRSLKTSASRRVVPLVGDALTAAKEAVAYSGERAALFPRYGREGGADAASGSIMKQIRAVTDSSLHVAHSLRHNMKDWMRDVGVTQLNQDLILGHDAGSLGDRVYGGSRSKLENTSRAISAALARRSEMISLAERRPA